MKLGSGLGLLAALVIAAACTDLRTAAPSEGAVDAGDEDAGGAVADAGAVDAGEDASAEPSPKDDACDEPWTLEPKTTATCASRTTTVLGPVVTAPGSIDIALTPAGSVGIVTNDLFDPFSGRMLLFTFPAGKSPPSSPVLLPRTVDSGGVIGVRAGERAAIMAVGPDTFGVVSHDVDDEANAGPIVYLEHVVGTGAFADAVTVASSVRGASALDVTRNAAGDVYVAYLFRKDAMYGDWRVARRLAVQSDFGSFASLAQDIFLDGVSPGNVSLGTLPSETPHALFHTASNPSTFVLKYAELGTGGWTAPKSLEPAVDEVRKGYSVAVANHGDRRFALYFTRDDSFQPAAATAEIHLATWTTLQPNPAIEIIATGLRAPDPDGSFRCALAVDRFGLAHIVYMVPPAADALPDGGVAYGALRYKRQTRLAGGKVEWRDDVIDPDASTASDVGEVAIVVDANVRPHIAYVVNGTIRYATRYDR